MAPEPTPSTTPLEASIGAPTDPPTHATVPTNAGHAAIRATSSSTSSSTTPPPTSSQTSQVGEGPAQRSTVDAPMPTPPAPGVQRVEAMLWSYQLELYHQAKD
eukprot:EG_transcript_16963